MTSAEPPLAVTALFQLIWRILLLSVNFWSNLLRYQRVLIPDFQLLQFLILQVLLELLQHRLKGVQLIKVL